MNVLRRALSLALLGTSLVARANFINFDNLVSGTEVGNAYLASDGVSFINGTALTVGGAPSAPNVLVPDTATLAVNSPVNVLVGSISFAYASTSTQTGGAPTLSVYTGQNGMGDLLGTLALADTGSSTNYATITLPFAGSAHSFVLNDSSFSRISYDNLSFTSQPAPEPSAFVALGLGAVVVIRRRKKSAAKVATVYST